MGHRTSNDEMMRVPRDFADYVRTEAPKRNLSFMGLMREMVLVHMDYQELSPTSGKVKKAKKSRGAIVAARKARKAKQPKRGPREPAAEKSLPRVTVAA